MWLPAIVLFTVIALAGFGVQKLGLGEDLEGMTSILLALSIGLVGNDIRRWWLDQKGYQEVAVVSGKNAEDAARRFLDAADIDRSGIYPGLSR
jgi:preprotein translocase subunit SecF